LNINNESKSQKPASASRNQSSKKPRGIGKLVEYVVLGKEITIDGKL
jgi:hypothetical protein